jgi:FHA domain
MTVIYHGNTMLDTFDVATSALRHNVRGQRSAKFTIKRYRQRGHRDRVLAVRRRRAGGSTGSRAGSQFLLDQPVASVGPYVRSDVSLDDVTVSRRQAELWRTKGDFQVIDVGSLNGIR